MLAGKTSRTFSTFSVNSVQSAGQFSERASTSDSLLHHDFDIVETFHNHPVTRGFVGGIPIRKDLSGDTDNLIAEILGIDSQSLELQVIKPKKEKG
jgi:hypothetical protein